MKERGSRLGMGTAGTTEIMNGAQLAARLAALNGLAPAPSRYVLFRATIRPGGHEVAGYELPGRSTPQNEAALERWLIQQGLAGAERLAVSVLVIREIVDSAGLIRECILERRRGAVDGPLLGEPARVEFVGPARAVRLYRVLRTGRLVEIPPSAEDDPEHRHAAEMDGSAFDGEEQALHARFGPDAVILDRRTPTLFEEMAGLSSVVHLRLPNGRTLGCGIGWHGTTPFLLVADFPRFEGSLALAPEQEEAVVAALRANDLVPYELRVDEHGLGLTARRRGKPDLFIVRPDKAATRLEAYVPGRPKQTSEDQQRWLHYTETYEHRTVLDVYHDGRSDQLVVLTADRSNQVWRHLVDADGVETSRKPESEAAVAVLHRERQLHRPAASPTTQPDQDCPTPVRPPPRDSLLAKALAYANAMTLIREAKETSLAAGSEAVQPPILTRLRALPDILAPLTARITAAAAQELIRQAEYGAVQPDSLAVALAGLEQRLAEELALIGVATFAPGSGAYAQEAPFGPEVDSAFPDAAYHIEEACRCLSMQRATAAAMHATRIVQLGLRAMADLIGITTPWEPNRGEQNWIQLMTALRHEASGQEALIESLDQVRRRWRSRTLIPADKYTIDEAQALIDAVAGFMRTLATCQVQGDATGTSGTAWPSPAAVS